MNEYFAAYEPDLRCYPNYSFEIGDIDGDGRMEMVSLNQNGNRLRAIDLNGEVLFERRVVNHGNWGSPLIGVADIDGDGCGEIIVPSFGPAFEAGISVFNGEGKKLMEIKDLPWSKLDPEKFPGWNVLPTCCHIVQWTPQSEPEIFLAEQAHSPTSHDCFSTAHFELNAFFLNLQGELLGTLPFADAQIEGYWYNGEVHSRVADVDGDGQQEIIFPRQDGRVMIIKKRRFSRQKCTDVER